MLPWKLLPLHDGIVRCLPCDQLQTFSSTGIPACLGGEALDKYAYEERWYNIAQAVRSVQFVVAIPPDGGLEVMRKLAVERTQWAVGNGFFHSGRVATQADSIHYVYDCGALQKRANQDALKREIQEFSSRTSRAHLFFLSHFDFDHVSGLPFLAPQISIDRFIIPMIPEQDRLLSLARQLRDGSFTPDGSDQAQFYQELIIDPSTALSDVARDGNQAIEVQVVSVSDLVADDGNLGGSASSPGLPELLAPNELSGATTGPLTPIISADGVNADCGGEIVWEWRHRIAIEAGNVVEHFTKHLVRLAGLASVADLTDPAVIRKIVLTKDAQLITSYNAAVAKIGKSFTRNMTSLMLYSGPPATARFRAYRSRSATVERAEIGAWNPRPGWLGLGDADLRAAKRIAHVNSVFQSQKPLVGTFAPSHHGSKRDWDMKLMDGFNPGADFTPTTVFGASGAYGHPHGEVLRQINERGGTTVIVGVAEEARWTEALQVYVKP